MVFKEKNFSSYEEETSISIWRGQLKQRVVFIDI